VFERQRGNDQWVVRYMDRVHGKKTYRCIYLGDADMAERTRELLQQWREERITPQERQQQARLQALDETAVALGFSGGARQRLKKAAQAAADDPRAMLDLVYSHPFEKIRKGGRPGRPGGSGLW
jgi:hypothetical protein